MEMWWDREPVPVGERVLRKQLRKSSETAAAAAADLSKQKIGGFWGYKVTESHCLL